MNPAHSSPTDLTRCLWKKVSKLAPDPSEPFPPTRSVLIHLRFYDRDRWLSAATGAGPNLHAALGDAIQRCWLSGLSKGVSHAVCVLPTDYVPIDDRNQARLFKNAHRGVLGLVLSDSSRPLIVSPTEVLARNQPLAELAKEELSSRGISLKEAIARESIFSFRSQQLYLNLSSEEAAVSLFRGSRTVQTEEVNAKRLRVFELDLSRWMLSNVQADGRLVYAVSPSENREILDNNMLRQFMGTVCLGRIAGRDLSISDEARELSHRNLEYNLRRTYRQKGKLGLIDCQDRVYLGSAALAQLAIIESEFRSQFKEEESGLWATLDALFHDSGKFTTWLRPEKRKDNQQFFPGETLLVWAFRYAEISDTTAGIPLRKKIFRAIDYYQEFHKARRQPAFVPWHTQAYFQLLTRITDRRLIELIFEMNDWLLLFQRQSREVYDDTLGRFSHPLWASAPPHASSTGVYLEGLVDAMILADRLGDTRRFLAYRRSIVLGLRSALQLQFNEPSEMYYISQSKLVWGGLRTSVYNNRIRVDNVQHVLMAVQKLVRFMDTGGSRTLFEEVHA